MRAESFNLSRLISNLLNVSVIAAQYKSKKPANQKKFKILILDFSRSNSAVDSSF